MVTPFETLNAQLVPMGAGVHLLHPRRQWPEFWEEIKDHAAAQSWIKNGVDEDPLSREFERVTFKGMRDFMDRSAPLQYVGIEREMEVKEVENDKKFPCDVYFCVALAKFLAEYHRLPYGNEFYPWWLDLNATCMRVQTVLPAKYEQDPTTTLSWMRNEYPNLSPNGLQDKFQRGVKYRVEKAYAGFIRELYVASSIATPFGHNYVPRIERTFPAQGVWVHPLLDALGKCDALVIDPTGNEQPRALAVYLDTPKSYQHIHDRKAHNILKGHLYSVVVKKKVYRNRPHTVFVPDEVDIVSIHGALAGMAYFQEVLKGAYL